MYDIVFAGARRAPANIELTKLFDDAAPDDSLAPYQAQIREWATSYLSAPHPELGREGPVCPYTAASIKKDRFWVGCVEGGEQSAEEIEVTVATVMESFGLLPPAAGPEALLKTVLILFPDVVDYSVIDQAQKSLKARSVPRGLMIGQFYPDCDEPGIRNPSFRPLRSPVALLAIRHMVSSDLPFLTANPDWVESYLRNFAGTIPAHMRNMIALKFDLQDPRSVGLL